MSDIQNFSDRVSANIETVIVGKHETLELTIVGCCARGIC